MPTHISTISGEIRRKLDAGDRAVGQLVRQDIAAMRFYADAGDRWAHRRDTILAHCAKAGLTEDQWCRRRLRRSLRTMRGYVQLARDWPSYEARRLKRGDCGRCGIDLALELIAVTKCGATAQRNGGATVITLDGYYADEHCTPRWFFDPLHAALNFTIDLCATRKSALLPRYYTPRQDGLSQDWRGERGFCNAPYARGSIEQWLRKGLDSGAESLVYLLPAAVNAGWWHDLVIPSATAVLFPRGRLTFGENQQSAPFDVALAVFAFGKPRVLHALAPMMRNSATCAGLVIPRPKMAAVERAA